MNRTKTAVPVHPVAMVCVNRLLPKACGVLLAVTDSRLCETSTAYETMFTHNSAKLIETSLLFFTR